MARYSSFLGRRVEVHYRAGDVVLPASGIFVADSGRSIFLEQILLQRGKQRHFRWEIPYRYIVRLEQKAESEEDAGSGSARETSVKSEPNRDVCVQRASSDSPALIPLSHGGKPA
jgi:hypothetical protein